MRDILKLRMNVNFDEDYGRYDFAPRVMRLNKDGETGYLLAYDPKDQMFLITWDDTLVDTRASWYNCDEFEILTGLVH